MEPMNKSHAGFSRYLMRQFARVSL